MLSPEKEIVPSVKAGEQRRGSNLKELDRIETNLDEMTRKADAAYAIMQTSKTVEIRPKPTEESKLSSKSSQGTTVTKPKKSQKENKKEKSVKSTSSSSATTGKDMSEEEVWASENQRLADEIAAAQAVLAMLKPDVKPKGSKQSCKGYIFMY